MTFAMGKVLTNFMSLSQGFEFRFLSSSCTYNSNPN